MAFGTFRTNDTRLSLEAEICAVRSDITFCCHHGIIEDSNDSNDSDGNDGNDGSGDGNGSDDNNGNDDNDGSGGSSSGGASTPAGMKYIYLPHMLCGLDQYFAEFHERVPFN